MKVSQEKLNYIKEIYMATKDSVLKAHLFMLLTAVNEDPELEIIS